MSEIVQEQIKEIEKLLKDYLRIKNEAKNARRAETEGTEDDSSPETKEKKVSPGLVNRRLRERELFEREC